MKLSQIAVAASTYFYAAASLAHHKPGHVVAVSEPSVMGLLGLGVVIALVATKFKK